MMKDLNQNLRDLYKDILGEAAVTAPFGENGLSMPFLILKRTYGIETIGDICKISDLPESRNYGEMAHCLFWEGVRSGDVKSPPLASALDAEYAHESEHYAARAKDTRLSVGDILYSDWWDPEGASSVFYIVLKRTPKTVVMRQLDSELFEPDELPDGVGYAHNHEGSAWRKEYAEYPKFGSPRGDAFRRRIEMWDSESMPELSGFELASTGHYRGQLYKWDGRVRTHLRGG
jgi:hypothetical protein